MIESFRVWGTMLAYGFGWALIPFFLAGAEIWITEKRCFNQVDNIHRKFIAGVGA